MKLSELRSKHLEKYFILKGVQEDQLLPKGYGGSEPICDPKKIECFPQPNSEAVKKMHHGNERIVLKVLEIDEE